MENNHTLSQPSHVSEVAYAPVTHPVGPRVQKLACVAGSSFPFPSPSDACHAG